VQMATLFWAKSKELFFLLVVCLNRLAKHRLADAVRAFALLVWFGTVVLSCRSVPAPPSESALSREFGQLSQTAQDESAVDDVDIYIDGSQSMQGFAASKQSNFCTMISELMLQAAAAQFKLTTYRFASDIRRLDRPALSQLQSQDFYTGLDTRLAELLNRIDSQPQHTAIIISDLVQSEPGADSQNLVRELAGIGSSTRQMDLMAFRSTYQGTYAPEYRQGINSAHININVSQKIPGEGRPFYLLIVAPNAASLSRVKEHLLNHRPAAEEFDASLPPINVKSIDLDAHSPEARNWDLYSTFARTPGNVAQFSNGILWQGPGGETGTVPLPLTLTLASPAEVRQPERLDLRVERGDWVNGEFAQASQTAIPVSGIVKDSEHLQLDLSLVRPEKQTWNIYFIRIGPGDANLDIPSWVSEWNTEDDGVSSAGNRTYQLRLLALAMVNAISERKQSGGWILEIARKV
jgi:hypothetical protein